VGQEEQALAVAVEPADGVHAGDRDEVLERGAALGVGELGQDVERLEQGEVTEGRAVERPSAACPVRRAAGGFRATLGAAWWGAGHTWTRCRPRSKRQGAARRRSIRPAPTGPSTHAREDGDRAISGPRRPRRRGY